MQIPSNNISASVKTVQATVKIILTFGMSLQKGIADAILLFYVLVSTFLYFTVITSLGLIIVIFSCTYKK